jgi:hypothetical protein
VKICSLRSSSVPILVSFLASDVSAELASQDAKATLQNGGNMSEAAELTGAEE